MGQPFNPLSTSRRFTPAGVALLYAALAALWIVASGTLLTLSVSDPVLQGRIELIKGLLFVLVTSGLLYLLLKQWRDPVAPAQIQRAHLPSGKARWQVLFFAVLAAAVPLAGFVVVKLHGPQVEREALANLQAIAELKASQIENWLAERYNDSMALISPPGFIRQVAALQQADGARVRNDVRANWLASVLALQYDAALLVDPQGRTLIAQGPFPHLQPPTAALLPKALTSARPQHSEIFADASGQLHLDFIAPLRLLEKDRYQPVGAVILNAAPERFLFPYIQHWPTASASGETLLVRRDGDAVLFINELRHRQGAGLSLRLPLDRADLPAAVAINEARPGTVQGRDYRGIPVFTAYRPVAGTDWVVVAKLDREEVLAPLRNLAFWVSLIALLAIVTIGAVMLLLWRQRWRTLRLEMQAQSDRLLRRFYDLPFIGIGMSSPTSKRWLQCNDRLCEILGYTREEMLRMSWMEMTHPDDLAGNLAEFERVLRGESEAYTLEKRFIRKDGSTVFAELDVKCARRADGTLEYLFATVQDITERKRSEAKIRRLTQIYAALSECNQAIVRCTSQEALFPQICQCAVRFGGMKMAWVGLVDPATRLLRPVASFGESTDYLQDVRISADAASAFGGGPTGMAIRELEPFWCQDFLNDPATAPWHERGARAGWMASAALPLTRNGVAIGALSLYAGETNAFDEAERNLLIEMGVDISFALTSFAREAERRQMETALRESESRFRDLYEKAPLAYQSLDIAGKVLDVNEAWLALLGRTRDEVVGRFIGDFLTDTSREVLAHEFPQFQKKGRVDGTLFHFVHKDGSQRLLMMNGQISCDKEGNFLRTHCILSDLTERLQSAEQLKLAAKVFEQSAEGIIITGADLNILMVNRAFSSITGYSAAETLGRNPRMLSSGHHDAHFYRALWDDVHSTGHWHGEMWNRRKDGNIYPELVSISKVLDADGKASHYVGIFSDISEHKANEAHIQRLAHYDPLTGLPNRSLLADRVGHAISRAQRSGEPLALFFLDLDRFKNVNDSLGHRIGDELLIQVGRRLKATVRDEDTVSRLGGDEFILVLPGTDSEGAAHVAEKLLEAIAQPYHIEQYELSITPSLGIAMYPTDGETYENLSMCADSAMYRAKQAGRNTYRYFTQEMQARSDRALQLENDLRRALASDQLHLHYQPQVALESGRIVGAEALLRWRHPELGMISPADFIPIAEDSGLILPIGEWVLRTATRQMRAWLDEGLAVLVMAVNLSAVQFRQARLPELVSQILAEAGLPAQCLELELTEGVAMDDPLAAIAVMDELHERGVRMSIDDFGTGYSSLSYLKRFQVGKLKIDQSFVRDISSDPEDRAIVDAIISLSRSLGLQTIAEGVETAEQLAFLREKGCDEVQGYHYSKALPAGEFEAFARAHRPAQGGTLSTGFEGLAK